MSRNGSGVYSLPAGSTATDGTTVLATTHNTPLADLETDMNTARPVVAGGTGAVTATAARDNLDIDAKILDKGAAYTAVAGDRSKLIRSTATMTLSLTAAATLASGWFIDVLATTGTLTIDPDGSETIDGASTLAVTVGKSCRIRCNGTAFYSQFLDTATYLENVAEDTSPQLGGPLDANSQAVFWSKGADVASASELLVLTDGNSFDVTGTTTITSIEHTADAFGVGSIINLHFDGVATLTHHATDLVLIGGNDITTAAGDTAIMQKYAAGDWRMISFNGISATADWGAGTSTKPSLASPADVKAAIDENAITIGRSITGITITSGSISSQINDTNAPKFYSCWLECVATDAGYSVGHVIPVTPNAALEGSSANSGFSIHHTGLAYFYRFGSATNCFSALNSSYAVTALDNAKWELNIDIYQ